MDSDPRPASQIKHEPRPSHPHPTSEGPAEHAAAAHAAAEELAEEFFGGDFLFEHRPCAAGPALGREAGEGRGVLSAGEAVVRVAAEFVVFGFFVGVGEDLEGAGDHCSLHLVSLALTHLSFSQMLRWGRHTLERLIRPRKTVLIRMGE